MFHVAWSSWSRTGPGHCLQCDRPITKQAVARSRGGRIIKADHGSLGVLPKRRPRYSTVKILALVSCNLGTNVCFLQPDCPPLPPVKDLAPTASSWPEFKMCARGRTRITTGSIQWFVGPHVRTWQRKVLMGAVVFAAGFLVVCTCASCSSSSV
jgi:hypothetical protein